jgi:undecaprenyl-diphosphatase
MPDWLHYMLLAILQGIAEILPISSSGHLALYQAVFNVNEGFEGTFSILLHIGSLVALILYFFPTLWRLLHSLIRVFFLNKKTPSAQEDVSLIGYLLLASIPAGIVGILIADEIDTIFANLVFVGVGFLLTSLLLWFVYRQSKVQNGKDTHSLQASLFAGFAQMLGIFPGVSRSGATISGALLAKLSLAKAKELSFLMFLPITAGSLLVSLDELSAIPANQLWVMILAATLSGVTTYVTISVVFKHLKIKHFPYFSLYLIGMGMLTLLLAWLP